jgi:hypothetical protein
MRFVLPEKHRPLMRRSVVAPIDGPLSETLESYGYSVDHIRRVILSSKADWKKREFQYAEKHALGSRFCFIEAVVPGAAMGIAFLDFLGAIDLFHAQHGIADPEKVGYEGEPRCRQSRRARTSSWSPS